VLGGCLTDTVMWTQNGPRGSIRGPDPFTSDPIGQFAADGGARRDAHAIDDADAGVLAGVWCPCIGGVLRSLGTGGSWATGAR
jgi:hypothetical protein